MGAVEIAALVAMLAVAVAVHLLGRRSPVPAGQGFGSARRAVRSQRNASAMSGEYLCVAMFLGIAGAVLTDGADALWYPIGFTAGFAALLVFVAGPLRRSGAYSVPDFVAVRLPGSGVRRLAALVAALIGVLYLVPQLHGAALLGSTVLSVPEWVGPVVLMVLVLANVLGGGMRAITVSLAFQYWLKLFAISAPTLVLIVVVIGTGPSGQSSDAPSQFTTATTVEVQTPVTLQFPERTVFSAQGTVDGVATDGEVIVEQGVPMPAEAGATLEFPAGSAVPDVVGQPSDGSDWLTPDSGLGGLAAALSVLLALVLGTMGLPHILARYYTNPDGTSARRTTLYVLVFVGLFAVFPIMLAALARLYVPQLRILGEADAAEADAVVLLLPSAVMSGVGGMIVTAVVVAGAFSAFFAAACGLVSSVAGIVAGGLLPERLRDGRIAVLLIGLAALGLALAAPRLDLAHGVEVAFALAASTLCPVLLLGIWWRGLTPQGAGAALVVGTMLVLGALAADLAGVEAVPVQHPALVSVPIAFLFAIGVSNGTRGHVPDEVDRIMLNMHAPDSLGFLRDKG